MIFEFLRIVLTWGAFAAVISMTDGDWRVIAALAVFWFGSHVMKMKGYELERDNCDTVFTMETAEIEMTCSKCGGRKYVTPWLPCPECGHRSRANRSQDCS